SGVRKPATTLSRVDLPQPEGPSTQRNSPPATSRLTCSSAILREAVSPNATVSFSTVIRPRALLCAASSRAALIGSNWPMALGPPHEAVRERRKSAIGGCRDDTEHDEPTEHLTRLHVLVREIDAVGKTGKSAGKLGCDQRVEGYAHRGPQPDKNRGQRGGKN